MKNNSRHSRYWREGFHDACVGYSYYGGYKGWRNFRKSIAYSLGYSAGMSAKRA